VEGWKRFSRSGSGGSCCGGSSRRPAARPALAVRDGREYVDFSSNDYLGLSSHPALVAAAREALDRYGVGSGRPA